jgi:hypothetical protein
MMQRGIKSIFAEIFPLHHAAGSRISLLHFAKMQRRVKGKIPGNISPLHDAAVRFHSPLHDAVGIQILPLHDATGSQILPPQDAAGSQFGNGESSLEDNHVKNHVWGTFTILFL